MAPVLKLNKETTMSFIEMGLGDDIKEPAAVDEGNYMLTVVSATEEISQNSGNPMIKIVHDIDGVDDADGVFVYLPLPTSEDDSETRKNKQRKIKRYLTLANIEYIEGGFELDDFFGARFEGFLFKEEIEQQDENAAPRFRNNLLIPRMSD